MRRCLSLATLLIALASSGCGAAAYNIRAYRAHALEQPSLPIVLDRADDLATSLDLVDRMLFETPYRAGDAWPDKVVLYDGRALSIRADVRTAHPYLNTDAPVPVVKLYRIHLEQELRAIGSPPGARTSLVGALATLSSQGRRLRTDWRAFADLRASLDQARADQGVLAAELLAPGRAPAPDDGRRVAAAAERVSVAQRGLDQLRADLLDAAHLAASSPLQSADRDRVLQDATAVVSVAYRIDLEALALLPVVAAQAVTSLPGSSHDLAQHPSLRALRQASDLPSFIGNIGSRFSSQLELTRDLTTKLAATRDVAVDDTPGFDLHESLVDQVVGITSDSFHADTRAGAEAFFYHQDVASNKADDESSSSSSSDTKITKDFTGRASRLRYHVKPIVLLAARLDLGFDAPNFPNAANLSVGYRTDRVYTANGSLQTSSSLGQQLGVHGVASDIIDFSAGIFGVHTSARLARFTAGDVRTQQVDPLTGLDTPEASAPVPLQLNFRQLDVGYDTTRFLGVGSRLMGLEELLVGFRYYSYGLPRILYELEDVNTDPKIQDYRFVRESPPQPVLTRLYMGGVMARFGGSNERVLSAFFNGSVFFGGGPIAYYFLRDPAQPDTTANRDSFRKAAFGLTAGLGLGVRFRLVSAQSPLRIYAEGSYQGDMVYSSVTVERAAVRQPDPNVPGVEVGTNRIVEFGGVDLFHGPRFSFVGTF